MAQTADFAQHFPSLNRTDQVFLDNAGGSQVLGSVVDAISDYLVNSNVQLGASYETGKKSTSCYEGGYQAAAKYINAGRDEIVLGSSTTQLFRNVAGVLKFSPGDEIILSAIDHEANIAAWVGMAEAKQLIIKWWQPSHRSTFSIASDKSTSPGFDIALTSTGLKPLLTPKSRFVSLTHVSNLLGTIHDIRDICETAHAHNPDILVCVDAVAYAPHRKIDVRVLGVDLYAFSWYKVYGPHMALLYASPRAQKQMASLGHFFNKHDTAEQRLGLAGASYELIASLPAVTEYLNDRWDEIYEQEGKLQSTLLDYLESKGDKVTVLGSKSVDGKVRVPTVSFTVKGWKSNDVVETVERETRFGFRWGMFYSNRLATDVLGLGNDGAVRVSMVHYNTVDQVKELGRAFDRIIFKDPSLKAQRSSVDIER